MAKVKESVESWKEWLNNKLHEKNAVTDVLEIVETKLGVQRIFIAYGVLAVLSLWLMIGYGAQLLCGVIGFIYPAYASIKAIESSSKDDDTQWLIYWVVYSVFALSELFTDILFFWIPFYWFFKCLFLVWCMAGQSWNGSNFVYSRVIRPLFLRHQDEIESSLNKAKNAAGVLIDEGNKLAETAAGAAAMSAVLKAAVNKAD